MVTKIFIHLFAWLTLLKEKKCPQIEDQPGYSATVTLSPLFEILEPFIFYPDQVC